MNQQLKLFNQGSVQGLPRKSYADRDLESRTSCDNSKPYRNGLGMLLPWEETSYDNC